MPWTRTMLCQGRQSRDRKQLPIVYLLDCRIYWPLRLVHKCQANRPDCILTDFHFPVVNANIALHTVVYGIDVICLANQRQYGTSTNLEARAASVLGQIWCKRGAVGTPRSWHQRAALLGLDPWPLIAIIISSYTVPRIMTTHDPLAGL